MSAASCPKRFEAEAMRDGRLTGAELTRFERHANVCAACSSEIHALEQLADAVRASVRDHAGADELRVRRERTRLLAAFDRALVSSERQPGRHRWLWPAATAAVIAGVFVFWHARAVVHPVPASNVVVHADSTAVWSRHTQSHRERIVLEHGALFVRVDHSVSTDQLVIELPDGELEDTGTIFSVSAEDGHTARVAVQEGSVVLRIRDKVPVALGAGETWTADETPGPPAMKAPVPKLDGGRDERVQRRRSSAARPSTRPDDRRDPAVDFYAAMAAFDRGDCRQAAAGFAGFMVAHPDDSRAEDAAYLRIMSLHKCGDEGGMKAAALIYLQHYPTGFRHVEVERLAR